MTRVRRFISRFSTVASVMLIVVLAMGTTPRAEAANSPWGQDMDTGTLQTFTTSFKVTGFVLKKTTNGIADFYWEGGSLSGIKVQIFRNASATTASGINSTTDSYLNTVSYATLERKGYTCPLYNNVPKNYYCFLRIAGYSSTGSAYGTWDPN